MFSKIFYKRISQNSLLLRYAQGQDKKKLKSIRCQSTYRLRKTMWKNEQFSNERSKMILSKWENFSNANKETLKAHKQTFHRRKEEEEEKYTNIQLQKSVGTFWFIAQILNFLPISTCIHTLCIAHHINRTATVMYV